jgi:hypothetical protein
VQLKYNDRQHAYWIDGKRCKGVTGLASIPDEKFALDQWRKRQVALGMALSPALVERAAVAYDDKEALNAIAEEALVAAKSHDARDRGTAAHRITERIDLDLLVVDTPLARAVQAAWKKALDDAGLEIVPEYVERIVCYPDRLIAGRFDRIARRKFDGTLVILDLKTGAGAIKYPHSVAIQLALYANAPLLAGPVPGDGGTTDEFTELPALSKSVGYVVHMPTDESVEVHPIDIAAGWEAAQQIVFPTLEWRARRDLVGTKPRATAATAPLTDNIRARLGILKMVDGARERVVNAWPTDVPPKPPWSDDQAKAIVDVLTRVELAVGAPF